MDGYNYGNFTLNSEALSVQELTESLSVQSRSLSLFPVPSSRSISLHPVPEVPRSPMTGVKSALAVGALAVGVAAMGGTTNNYRLKRDITQDYINMDGIKRYKPSSSPPPPPPVDGIIVGSGGNLSVMLTHFTFRKETFQYLSRNLVGDWKDLGRCLDVVGPILDILENKHDTQEAAYQTILHWAVSNGSKATPNILAKGLRKVARTDLAEYVEKKER